MFDIRSVIVIRIYLVMGKPVRLLLTGYVIRALRPLGDKTVRQAIKYSQDAPFARHFHDLIGLLVGWHRDKSPP